MGRQGELFLSSLILSLSTVALPIPEAPPVTTAALPSNLLSHNQIASEAYLRRSFSILRRPREAITYSQMSVST